MKYYRVPENLALGGSVAQSLPYLPSNKNVQKLFDSIASAAKPSTFTHEYLQKTIGLKGTNDRPLIPMLRTLGFLDAANVPTSTYDLLKNKTTAKAAIADGIRKAYDPVFKANEKANELGSEPLKGLISQVSGADEGMVDRITNTFNTLARLGDFNATAPPPPAKPDEFENNEEDPDEEQADKSDKKKISGLRPEFHYNIQIHLPGNGTEETYLNIFNALRRTFK